MTNPRALADDATFVNEVARARLEFDTPRSHTAPSSSSASSTLQKRRYTPYDNSIRFDGRRGNP